MKFLNKLGLRKRVSSYYADHLPSDIRYRNRAGEEVSVPIENATVDELAFAFSVPIENATVDELAFALQLASEEQSIVSRRRSAIEDLYQNARKSGALGADRMTDIAWKE